MSPLVMREAHLRSLKQHGISTPPTFGGHTSHDDWLTKERKLIKDVDPSFDSSLLCPVTSASCHVAGSFKNLGPSPDSDALSQGPLSLDLLLSPNVPYSALQSPTSSNTSNEFEREDKTHPRQPLLRTTTASSDLAHVRKPRKGSASQKPPKGAKPQSHSSVYPVTKAPLKALKDQRRVSIDVHRSKSPQIQSPSHGWGGVTGAIDGGDYDGASTCGSDDVGASGLSSIQWFDSPAKPEPSGGPLCCDGSVNLLAESEQEEPRQQPRGTHKRAASKEMASFNGSLPLLPTDGIHSRDGSGGEETSDLDVKEFEGTPCVNFSDVEKLSQALDEQEKAIEGLTLILIPVSELCGGKMMRGHEVVFAVHEEHKESPVIPGFRSSLSSLTCC